ALHLAPGPAHDVLAHRSAEQAPERAAYAARVGARQIAAGNYGIGGHCATLIASQRVTLPFRRLAVARNKPRPWHRDLGPTEFAGQRPCPPAVPMAHSAGRSRVIAAFLRSPVPRPRQHGIEFGLDHRFYERANALANTSLDRIKPIVEKLGANISR